MRTCPMCSEIKSKSSFSLNGQTSNYCSDCELGNNGFSSSTLAGLKAVQRQQERDEQIAQAVQEAYENSEAQLKKVEDEKARKYLEENPPILNEKYTDIRHTIPKYEDLD